MIDSSFDEFVHGHIVALDRYAFALTGERHAAEELVQETLVRVAGAWRRVHREGNPAGYATTVMFRTHVSLWRRRRTRVATVELAVDPPADSDGFAAVDARLTLRRALRALPPLQQAVLVATYLRDSPDDEIAELVGRSTATVRSLRHRGLKALAAALQPDGDPPVRSAFTPPPTNASPAVTPGRISDPSTRSTAPAPTAPAPAVSTLAGTVPAATAPSAAPTNGRPDTAPGKAPTTPTSLASGSPAPASPAPAPTRPADNAAVAAPPVNVPANRPDSGAGEEVPRGAS